MSLVNDLRKAAGFEPDRVPEISWENRLAQAAYTPPSGLRITFDYEDIETSFSKRTSTYEFPDADGTLVQDHGTGGRRFPHRIFFSGPDHDKQAAVFEAALMETGYGKLESPLYGEHTVVPVGDISRKNGLKTRANQTVFEVTFFKTIENVYPAAVEDTAGAVVTALELYGELGAAEFASKLSIVSVGERKGVIDTVNDLVKRVDKELAKVAAVQGVINDAFNDAIDSINGAIDTLVGTPLALARQTQIMINAPSKAMANISDRFKGYGNLAADIFNATDAISLPGGPGGNGPRIDANVGIGNDAESPNRFHVRDLFAGNFVAGSINSTMYTMNATGSAASLPGVKIAQADNIPADNKIDTAPKAIAAAEILIEQFEAFRAWRDANLSSIEGDISTPGNMDPGGAFSALWKAYSLAVGNLIELSFTLLKERRIELDRARTPMDLVSELYDGVDEWLDFFIRSNNLALHEILEIPKGREIVYYV